MSAPLQGEIYLASLDPVRGHEQGGTRPVLVLQNNTLNQNLSTITVAPVTSNLKAKGKLTTYFLPAKLSKLDKDSVALLYQIRALDKTRLTKKISILKPDNFREILSQLRLVF